MEKNIGALISSLHRIQTPQFQLFGFAALKAIIPTLSSSEKYSIFEQVSKLLLIDSNHVTIEHIERQVTLILELLNSPSNSVGVSSSAESELQLMKHSIQIVIQNLTRCFPKLTFPQRNAILKMVVKSVNNSGPNNTSSSSGSGSAKNQLQLPPVFVYEVILNTLFIQTIASYENEFLSQANKRKNVDNIALSRAAQRRAHRLATSSAPEQYFQVAINFFLTQVTSGALQVNLLDELVNSVQLFFIYLSQIATNEHCTNDYIQNTLQFLASLAPSLYMTSKSHGDDSDAEEMMAMNEHEQKQTNRGFASTISTLYLEYILEILEHSQFHLSLAKDMEQKVSGLENKIQIQHQLLELTDSILQLITTIELAQRQALSMKDHEKLYLRLERETYYVSKVSSMKMLLELSLNCIGGMHKLLDSPSFISILQELLNHELLAVRQKAVIILRERLEELSLSKTKLTSTAASNNNRANNSNLTAEAGLYYDLFVHMKSILDEYLSSSSTIAKNGEIQFHFTSDKSAQSALAQSAAMCLDIMIQYMGGIKSWKDEVTKFLNQLIQRIPVMYKSFQSKALEIYDTGLLDGKKLLGSLLLCLSSQVKVLGAGALPFVQVRSLTYHLFLLTLTLILYTLIFSRKSWQFTVRYIPMN
jgi:hypothetical protein